MFSLLVLLCVLLALPVALVRATSERFGTPAAVLLSVVIVAGTVEVARRLRAWRRERTRHRKRRSGSA